MLRMGTALFILGITSLMLPVFASGAVDDLSLGATLYRQNCFRCHYSVEKMAKHQNLVDAIRKPRFTMPKFGQDKLSDDEVRVIVNFIKSREEK